MELNRSSSYYQTTDAQPLSRRPQPTFELRAIYPLSPYGVHVVNTFFVYSYTTCIVYYELREVKEPIMASGTSA